MANINVTYEAMEQEAQALLAGKAEIESNLTSLANRITNLVSSGFVTDSASGAFNQMYQDYTTSAKNTIASLEQIAQTLRQMAEAMRETDQQLARSIGGN